jgi:hypothetical protein
LLNEPSWAIRGAMVDLMGPFEQGTFSLIGVHTILCNGFSLYSNLLTKLEEFKEKSHLKGILTPVKSYKLFNNLFNT